MNSIAPSLAESDLRLDKQRRRGMLFLSLAAGALGFALMMQIGLNDNFLVDVIGINGPQKGQLEAWRESCGITAFLFLALLAGLSEPIIAALALTVFGLALAAYSAVPNFLWLVACSVVWSQGLHVWFPLPNSMTLALAEPNQSGRRLGQIQAAGAIGSFLALGVALALCRWHVPIRPMYFVAGGGALVAAACCLGIPRDIKTPGPRFVFRKEYGLYYMLTFLEGWRKQIVLAFGSFLLVKVYHTPLAAMLILWMVIQAVGWVASPRVGRLIDRIGERKVLIFYYSSMAVVFCGYIVLQLLPDYLRIHLPAVGNWMTFDRTKHMLWGLFVLDGSFFVLAMAMTTYVRKIAPVIEHTPTLSMGVAMNHVSAVSMPLLGGYLWLWFGPTGPFWAGIIAAIASAALAFLVPPPHKMPQAR